ncbi:hypothetical protein TWF718_002170 [Orbilia javanica]|uniref:Uncharacterized protein n=1 Tax=Orbilia javanica TaxID=47235 RepID=A0AAN8R8J1_9PEZI
MVVSEAGARSLAPTLLVNFTTEAAHLQTRLKDCEFKLRKRRLNATPKPLQDFTQNRHIQVSDRHKSSINFLQFIQSPFINVSVVYVRVHIRNHILLNYVNIFNKMTLQVN